MVSMKYEPSSKGVAPDWGGELGPPPAPLPEPHPAVAESPLLHVTGCLNVSIKKDVFRVRGKPSKSAIREKLDRAPRIHGLESTEENYSRAGSCLIALSKRMVYPK